MTKRAQFDKVSLSFETAKGRLQVVEDVSYDINDNLAVSFEGINIFEESLRHYARDKNELWFAQELDTRYLLGLRYRF